MPPHVTLYSKPGCHLCESVERQIRGVSQRIAFDFEVVNIMGDPALAVRYGFDIPVVAIDGVTFCEHVLDIESFETRLLALGSQTSGRLAGDSDAMSQNRRN